MNNFRAFINSIPPVVKNILAINIILWLATIATPGIFLRFGINAKLEDFAKKYNAKYILVNSAQNRPLSDAIVKELGLGERYPIPTLAMYKNGVLINHYVGATQEEFIESDIKNALGK